MRFFISVILFVILSSQFCIAKELYKAADGTDLYNSLSVLENQVYGRDYNNEEISVRIERLESSLFKSTYRGSYQARIDKLKSSIAATKTQNINIKQQVILELLENRYLGKSYKSDKFEDRLTRLENTVLGMQFLGNAAFRFDNLVKKIPLSIIGISVTDSSGGKASIKPEIKAQESYSPLALDYAGVDGDYFDNLARTRENKVLRWRDFPIYVYLGKSIDDNNMKSGKKAIEEWGKFIQLTATNDVQAANIVIKWYAPNNESEGPIRISYGSSNSQIIINGAYYKNPADLDRFIMHEMGHAIGIWGHSNNPQDIMYNFKEIGADILTKDYTNTKNAHINSAPTQPSKRDINTLIRIYSSPSGTGGS